MDFDLEKLSVPELSALIERAQEEIKHRKISAKDKLKQEIEEKLKHSGLNLADLFPGAGKKGKSQSKTVRVNQRQ